MLERVEHRLGLGNKIKMREMKLDPDATFEAKGLQRRWKINTDIYRGDGRKTKNINKKTRELLTFLMISEK